MMQNVINEIRLLQAILTINRTENSFLYILSKIRKHIISRTKYLLIMADSTSIIKYLIIYDFKFYIMCIIIRSLFDV